MNIEIPYGKKDLFDVDIPDNQLVGVYNPNSVKKLMLYPQLIMLLRIQSIQNLFTHL